MPPLGIRSRRGPETRPAALLPVLAAHALNCPEKWIWRLEVNRELCDGIPDFLGPWVAPVRDPVVLYAVDLDTVDVQVVRMEEFLRATQKILEAGRLAFRDSKKLN